MSEDAKFIVGVFIGGTVVNLIYAIVLYCIYKKKLKDDKEQR